MFKSAGARRAFFAGKAAAKFLKADGTWTAPAGSGTVTSVQVAGANGLSFSGGPITGSGTITASLTVPKVTTYTSGSGTFTKTGSPLYIRVRMVGGGGGGTNGGVGSKAGGGGSAGGYVDAIITSPSSTYAYAVGAGGSGGAGLNGAFAGGAGGSGFIEVTEYYQ